MSKLKPATQTLEVAGHKVDIVVTPPPHLMFLSSKLSEMDQGDMLLQMRMVGGLAAMVVTGIDGEEVVNESRLPRTLDEMAELGERFIMAVYDLLGGYESIQAMLEAIMSAYNGEKARANPT